MIPSIELNKKTVILIAFPILVILIIIVFIGPLFTKAKNVASQAKALDIELAEIRNALMKAKKLDQKGHLLSRNEVSSTINEITSVGNQYKINFLSTSPQQIVKNENSEYPVLPIRLEIKSTFRDLGIFLGSLSNLEKSVVTVKEFSIERDQEILPEIITVLIVEIYLKAGESG